MVIIVMGVCGCGKTTIGELLARELDWHYCDADDYHPEANVAKMASGMPLDDRDRYPWLHILAKEIGRWIEAEKGVVLGCSALKESYREILVDNRSEVEIVYLRGTKELIKRRLSERVHRYMPASLLDSQFATLEEPQDAVVVDIDPTPDEIVRQIRSELGI